MNETIIPEIKVETNLIEDTVFENWFYREGDKNPVALLLIDSDSKRIHITNLLTNSRGLFEGDRSFKVRLFLESNFSLDLAQSIANVIYN